MRVVWANEGVRVIGLRCGMTSHAGLVCSSWRVLSPIPDPEDTRGEKLRISFSGAESPVQATAGTNESAP